MSWAHGWAMGSSGGLDDIAYDRYRMFRAGFAHSNRLNGVSGPLLRATTCRSTARTAVIATGVERKDRDSHSAGEYGAMLIELGALMRRATPRISLLKRASLLSSV